MHSQEEANVLALVDSTIDDLEKFLKDAQTQCKLNDPALAALIVKYANVQEYSSVKNDAQMATMATVALYWLIPEYRRRQTERAKASASKDN